MLSDRLNQDLKSAMLQKDVLRTTVLRSLKSALTYAQVAAGADSSLTDESAQAVLAKEAKRRQESADAFAKAGSSERAATELEEKTIIEAYLPAVASEAELRQLVADVLAETDGPHAMGPVIAAVKQRTDKRVDGGLLAKLVKEAL